MENNFGLHTLDGEWHALLPRYLFVADQLKGKRVLEIGCGRGVGTALLHKAGVLDLTAIDHRPELVQDAQAHFDGFEGVFQLMFYEEMDFEDESFDAVICLDDSFPIADEAFLKEVQRVLRAEGLFIGALESEEAYGLDKVLPRYGDPLRSRRISEETLSHKTRDAFESHFDKVRLLKQTPQLSFTFAAVQTPRKGLQNLFDAAVTSEFTLLPEVGEAPAQEDTVEVEKSDERILDGDFLRLAGHSDTHVTSELVVCTRGGFEVSEGLWSDARVWMPYDAISMRLGRILNDLYRHIDELDQRTLVFEEQVDEDVKLIDDLEEEVRSQRALSHDQASQLEDLKDQLTHIAQVPDLSVEYARSQGELATKQQVILELTADFNRRVQDMVWTLEERDAYIDRLAHRVREWEQYSRDLGEQLEARNLALDNQGRVLDKLRNELSALRGEVPVVEVPEDADESVGEADEVETEDEAIQRALEDEQSRLEGALVEAQTRYGEAYSAAARARDALQRASDELDEKSAYAAKLETRLEEQEQSARAFAQEVGGLYEEVNDLKKALEKANARIEDLGKNVTKTRESTMNLEREMERRSEQILGLKRELMGKEIENKSLERESITLLKAKSERDKVVKAREETIEARDETIAGLKAKLEALQVSLGEANDRAESAEAALVAAQSEPEPEPVPEVIEVVEVAQDTPDEAPEAPVVSHKPFTEGWLKTEGYLPSGQNLWRLDGRLVAMTSRYWVQVTDLGDGRVKIEGSKARATRIKKVKLADLLADRFGLSTRLVRQVVKATVGADAP